MRKYYRSSQPLANAGSRRIGGQFATAVIFMPLTRTAATLDQASLYNLPGDRATAIVPVSLKLHDIPNELAIRT
jgi:hypothetical protein